MHYYITIIIIIIIIIIIFLSHRKKNTTVIPTFRNSKSETHNPTYRYQRPLVSRKKHTEEPNQEHHHAPPFFILFFVPFPNLKRFQFQHSHHHHHHYYGNTRSGDRVEAPERSEHGRETDERAPQLTLAGHRHRPRRPRREEFDPQTGLLHQGLRFLTLYLRESSLRPRRRRSQQQDAARPVHLRRLLGTGLAGSRPPRRQAPPRKTPSGGHARALDGSEGPEAQFCSQKRVLGK